jgi:light-regulated signal transduction histidine kinase (bacteriophytochrome)
LTDTHVDLEGLLHRLRSPLAVIHTTTSLLGEMPDDKRLGDVRRHLRLIDEAVARASHLMDEAAERPDRS